MPRPRVRSQDRIRTAKACITCKVSKKRCNAELPCSLCIRKGRADLCTYPSTPRGAERARRPPESRHTARLISPDQSHPPLSSPRRGRSPESVPSPSEPYQNARDGVATRAENQVDTRDSSPQCSQQPTMLLSSRGEHVYIGNAAAISFLRFLQKTLKRYIGPSAFTERQRNDTMLEIEVQNKSDHFEDNLDSAGKQDLIQCFMQVSNGILHLFSDEEISRISEATTTAASNPQVWTCSSQHDDLACLYLMIAIGAQSRGRDPDEVGLSRKYFVQAQRMAFIDLLQDPTFGMIRVFLLMACYMLGACRRNTAFMYIGIASKAAIILGLHMPYHRATVEERATRRRTWQSLRVLDLLCSSILGRPSSTPSIQRDEYEMDPLSSEGKDHRTIALSANYESSSIIDSIVQSLAKSSILDATSTENYLQTLREWSQALPTALRKSVKGSINDCPSDINPCEMIIGNIHVACTYYFGVVLVTRQYLILRVMSRLRKKQSQDASRADFPSEQISDEAEKASQFSAGCVSSAAYMAQLCYDASQQDIFLDNMFILKAWLFSAGLVLGFSLLMEGEDKPENREYFRQSRETLHRFARLSPQAEQYHEILTNFSIAIEKYRQQTSSRPANPYVEQIMTIETDNLSGRESLDAQSQTQGVLQTPCSSLGDEDFARMFAGDFLANSADFPNFSTQTEDDIGLQLIWDSYNMQIPEYPTI